MKYELIKTKRNTVENQNKQSKDALFIKGNDIYNRIETVDIEWVESDGNYSIINTNDKKFAVKISLTKFKQELPEGNFIQIHKRYIVNIKKINGIDPLNNEVILDTQTIPIGRTYKKELLNRLKLLH